MRHEDTVMGGGWVERGLSAGADNGDGCGVGVVGW